MISHEPHNQLFTEFLIELIHANLGNESFGAKELAEAAGISQRKLSQKMRSIKKSSVSRFICETHLLKALELLHEADMTAAEVAYKVGFGSATYFNKCFHDFFGYPPGKIRKGEINSNYQERIKEKNISGLLSGKSYFKIASYIFGGLVLISGLLLIGNSLSIKKDSAGTYLLPPKRSEISIAILPFQNLSDSTANQYFIEGLTEDILTRLSAIHSLRVISHESAEQFRGSAGSSHEIGKKLNVEYLVTGSGQKYNNAYMLRVQLVDCKNDEQLWSESYSKEIRDTKDIFETQSEIARAIVTRLQASITPVESRYIEKAPTADLSAYYYYLKGNEEILQSSYPDYKPEHIKRANLFFRRALEIDSSFAQAYIGIGYGCWQKTDRDLTVSDNKIFINSLDSMLLMANTALSYDPDICMSYCMKAAYYAFRNDFVKALNENSKGLECNRNEWFVNYQRGDLYSNSNLVKALEIAHKASCLGSGKEVSQSLNQIGNFYLMAGFPARGNFYFLEAFKLDGDSARYACSLAGSDFAEGYFKDDTESYDKLNVTGMYESRAAGNKGLCRLFLGRNQEALNYFIKYFSVNKENKRLLQSLYQYIGYAYRQNGYTKEANKYFKKTIELNKNRIKYSLPADHYSLAGVYAAIGEKEKAYDNLNIFNKKECFTSLDLIYLKNDPLFNGIRNEPRFLMIVNSAESKFNAEHNRVKNWLRKNGEF